MTLKLHPDALPARLMRSAARRQHGRIGSASVVPLPFPPADGDMPS